MRKLTLVIDEDLMGRLGLTTNASDEVAAGELKKVFDKAGAHDNLKEQLTTVTNERDTLTGQVAQLKRDTVGNTVKDMLDKAQEGKQITNELRTQFEKDYAENPTGLQTVLNAMKPQQVITNDLNGGTGGADNKTKKQLAAKFDELHKEGGLLEVKNSNPDYYKELFQAKHGRLPNI